MGEFSDREALRRLLRRVEAIQFEPTAEERRVLTDCENRVLLWATAAGVATSSAAAFALRRAPFPGPMSRLMANALPGALAAHTAVSFAGERCLCDLVAIAERSPLGGEAVRILQAHNPQSLVLQHAPPSARWSPDSLPRLPEPHSGEAIRERVATLAPKAAPAPPAASDGWGAEPNVLRDLLGSEARDAPPPGQKPPAPPAKQDKAW